ncbi:MAG: Secretion system C-terminal sorting domain [Bacteroidota bacterium]
MSLLTVFIPLAGFTQFLKIYHKESNTEVTGSSYFYFFNSPDGEQTWSGKIKNISGGTANVRVLRTQLTRLAGSTDYYCWNVCLDSTVSLSGAISLNDNQTDSTSFHAMYRCNGANGTSSVNYRFFDASNATDTTSVTVHYISTPTSINELTSTVGLISSIGPVPTSETVQIGYQLGAAGNTGIIEIYDISGKTVSKHSISGNTLSVISLSGLSPGIYSVRLIAANGLVDTRKILIQ